MGFVGDDDDDDDADGDDYVGNNDDDGTDVVMIANVITLVASSRCQIIKVKWALK